MSFTHDAARSDLFVADACVIHDSVDDPADCRNGTPAWMTESTCSTARATNSAVVLYPAPDGPQDGPLAAQRPRVSDGPAANNGYAPAAQLVLPCYLGEERCGSLVIAAHRIGGTLEIWSSDEQSQTHGLEQLRLESGYFGVQESFRRVTGLTKFGIGEGLPGSVRAEGRPVLLDDLTANRKFLRVEAAISADLAFGLGLPVPTPRGMQVAVLLSSRRRPFARHVHLFRQSEVLEHVQGLSVEERPDLRASMLERARELAVATLARRQPLAYHGTFGDDGFAFTWPSRDLSGIMHVATLLG